VNGGFIEENEPVVSEVLCAIHCYPVKVRGFREDVREITMRCGEGSSFYWRRQRHHSPFAEDFHHEVISQLERPYVFINALIAIIARNFTGLIDCGSGGNLNFVNAENHVTTK